MAPAKRKISCLNHLNIHLKLNVMLPICDKKVKLPKKIEKEKN